MRAIRLGRLQETLPGALALKLGVEEQKLHQRLQELIREFASLLASAFAAVVAVLGVRSLLYRRVVHADGGPGPGTEPNGRERSEHVSARPGFVGGGINLGRTRGLVDDARSIPLEARDDQRKLPSSRLLGPLREPREGSVPEPARIRRARRGSRGFVVVVVVVVVEVGEVHGIVAVGVLDALALGQLSVLDHEPILVVVRHALALVVVDVLVGEGFALLHLLPFVARVEVFAILGDVLDVGIPRERSPPRHRARYQTGPLGEHPRPPERRPAPVHREGLRERFFFAIRQSDGVGSELKRVPVGPFLDARAVDDDVRRALHADELATLGLGVGADGDDARIDGVLEGAVGSEEALVATSLGHSPGAPPVAARQRGALATPPETRVLDERGDRRVGAAQS